MEHYQEYKCSILSIIRKNTITLCPSVGGSLWIKTASGILSFHKSLLTRSNDVQDDFGKDINCNSR